MEWLGELKSDADDPELQPVSPSVTQGFKAIIDEDRNAGPAARPAQQDPAAPAASGPFTGPIPVLDGEQPPASAGTVEGPEQEFARALEEERAVGDPRPPWWTPL